jgi:hypothetical protein
MNILEVIFFHFKNVHEKTGPLRGPGSSSHTSGRRNQEALLEATSV